MKNRRPIRVGIAGLDHFYIALGAINDLKLDDGAQISIIAHRDIDIARQVAAPLNARWTTDYAEVVDSDIDLLVTACPTSVNVQLVLKAVQRGRHILSVKPFAMNQAEGKAIVNAVKKADVRFMSYDVGFRFNPMYLKMKKLLDAGNLGKPLSAYCYFRTALPDIAWFGAPALRSRTWWLDPEKTPAGAWLDHAIYFVDLLRWMFSAEVECISGKIANLRHSIEPLEDYGTAMLVFHNGQVATIEASWIAEMSSLNAGFQLLGSHGQVLQETITRGQMLDLRQENQLKWIDYRDQVTGWQQLEVPAPSTGLTAHMLRVLRGEEDPIASEDDAIKSLTVCLSLYQAAKEMKAVSLI